MLVLLAAPALAQWPGALEARYPRTPRGPVAAPAIPGGAVTLSAPCSGWQATIDANSGSGTVYKIASGTYRECSIELYQDDELWGADDSTVLKGSRVLTGWALDTGSRYEVTGVTDTVMDSDRACQSGVECTHTATLYQDGVRLTPADSCANVDAVGEWFFDQVADTVCIHGDPAGTTTEFSSTTIAVTNGVANRTGNVIANLKVEQYASPELAAGSGFVVRVKDGTVDNVWIGNGSGACLRLAGASTLSDSVVSGCGSIGVAGPGASNSVVRNNEFTNNNTQGLVLYGSDAVASDAKFTSSVANVLIEKNWAHDTDGKGLWVDIGSTDATIQDNWVEGHAAAGIVTEISFDTIIQRNVVVGVADEGLRFSSSEGTQILGNLFWGNLRAIRGLQACRDNDTQVVSGLDVTGNHVYQLEVASPDEDGKAFQLTINSDVTTNCFVGDAKSDWFDCGTNKDNCIDGNSWFIDSVGDAAFRWWDVSSNTERDEVWFGANVDTTGSYGTWDGSDPVILRLRALAP